MNRLTASILAIGLAATGTATAQSSGYYPQSGQYGQSGQYNQNGQYGQPSVDRYGQSYGAQYEYARVVRVDPVLQSGYGSQAGYGSNGSQRCYTRNDGYVGNNQSYGNDGYYAGNGGYNNGGYASNGYSNDGYSNNGYTNSGYNNNGYNNNGYNNNAGGSQAGRTVATVIGGVLGAAIGSKVGGGSARYATSALGSMVGGMAGRTVYEANQRARNPRTAAVTVCDPVPASNGGYYPASDRGVSAYDVTYEYAGRRYATRTNYHPGDRIRVRVDVRPE